MSMPLPFIDVVETGNNIYWLMTINGLSVKDLQGKFGFSTPQAIYKWVNGKSLPTIDNLVSLAYIFNCKIDDIIIIAGKIRK